MDGLRDGDLNTQILRWAAGGLAGVWMFTVAWGGWSLLLLHVGWWPLLLLLGRFLHGLFTAGGWRRGLDRRRLAAGSSTTIIFIVGIIHTASHHSHADTSVTRHSLILEVIVVSCILAHFPLRVLLRLCWPSSSGRRSIQIN